MRKQTNFTSKLNNYIKELKEQGRLYQWACVVEDPSLCCTYDEQLKLFKLYIEVIEQINPGQNVLESIDKLSYSDEISSILDILHSEAAPQDDYWSLFNEAA